MCPVGGQAIGCGEGDDRDPGVTELVEVIAHGDHVFLAGQSSEVPVQDQHEWSPSKLGRSPWPPLMVGELDVGERVTDAEGHVVSPVGALLRNRRRRVGVGKSPGAAATWRTRRALGLIMLTSPMVTVGTVS